MTAIARPEHSHKPHKCVSRHAAHATLHTIHSHLSSRLSALSHTFPGTQMSLPLSQSGRAEGMPTQAACFAPVQKRKSPGGGCLRGSRGGGYLLFHFRSIIGVARFNFSVRNGKRWSPCAIATLVSFHSSQICDGVWGERVTGSGFGAMSGRLTFTCLLESLLTNDTLSVPLTRPAMTGQLGGDLRPGKGLGD